MATTKEYYNYVIDNLNKIEGITNRPMMGEYLLYYNSLLFGGIYDNRVLVKITDTNKKYNMEEAIPYKGAKLMYHLKDLENEELVKNIILDTCKGLPLKKKK